MSKVEVYSHLATWAANDRAYSVWIVGDESTLRSFELYSEARQYADHLERKLEESKAEEKNSWW